MLIKTKYLGPTNFKGARIKASCGTRSKTIPFDYSVSASERHEQAARLLAAELGWKAMVGDESPKGGYVFVRADFGFVNV